MSVENRNCGCGCGCNNMMNNEAVSPEEEMMNNCSCEEFRETRREMAEKIKCLDFAIIELALYLDTHPDDQKALCLHRKYAKEVKELKDKYQKVYGPLTIEFPCNKWRWLEEPWPWERGNF